MNNKIEKIYERLGLENQFYSGPGGEDYKKFKWNRFIERLKICLFSYTCYKMQETALNTALQQLPPKELSLLKTYHSPRELLTIFLGWRKGEILFISDKNHIQLTVKYKDTEYDFTEFIKPFRKRCQKQEEANRVKDLLCLKVLETLIQEGEIILD